LEGQLEMLWDGRAEGQPLEAANAAYYDEPAGWFDPPCLTNLTNIQLMLLLLMMQLGCEAPVQYIQQDAVLNIWSWAGHNVIYIDI